MSHRTGKRRSAREAVNCDLELRPLMNVFIVLIPMLLLSAVFMEIRVIEMTLPRAAEAAENQPPAERFELAIHIRENAYVLEANGQTLQIVPRLAGANGRGTPDAASAQGLTQALDAIVAAHPKQQDVRIVAGSATRYEELVAVMDLARAAGLPQAALEGADQEGN